MLLINQIYSGRRTFRLPKFQLIRSKVDYIYLGVLLHNVGLLLFWALRVSQFQFLMFLGPICFLYGLYTNRRHIIHKKFHWSYYLLLAISLLMWLRFDPDGANGGTVQDMNGAFAMFFFLLFWYDSAIFKLQDMQRWAIIGSICGVLFAIMNWQYILAANAYQGSYSNNDERAVNMAMSVIYILMGSSFLLFTYRVTNVRLHYYGLFMTLLAIVVAMASGRRGYSVINMLFVVQFMFFHVWYSKGKRKKWGMLGMVCVLLFCYRYYLAYKDTQLSMFFDRLDTDSRTGVFYYWSKDMNQDWLNWVWGKGVSGGYYDGGFGAVRPGIENGVRQMILKGGLLYLLSYMLLSLVMAYRAFFKSNNALMKGMAVYILLLFIFLFVWGTPSISFTHLYMWIAFTWINNKRLRRMTDAEIRQYLLRP